MLMPYAKPIDPEIGDRAFDLIPVAKPLDAGAHVSFSSDWDADPLSPFGVIERAVTRESNATRRCRDRRQARHE
ncbi:hypothetical protein ACFXGT_29290 [Streptomyces sp. NPDC059352]|uniref:hypothetical protein n=1 Tax=Streptomyces sp. NPDC059352 TaxID=3346810 RepID=UPI00367B6E11